MRLQIFLKETRKQFRDAGISTPELDARFLLQDLFELSDTDFLSSDADLTSIQMMVGQSAVQRRLNGEPISRILGYKEFWGRRFHLSPATLDPRPDTETLIEAVLSHEWNAPKILDLGTGTGCILLTLLHEIRGSTGVGVDLSSEACETAKTNAKNHNLDSRVRIQNASWTDSLEGKFDLIVSNPPYIPSGIIPTLSEEVQNHDPILALDGGEDGLEPYKILLSNLKKFLEPRGLVFFEIGQGQEGDIERLAHNIGATLCETYADLGGVTRVLKIRYGDN